MTTDPEAATKFYTELFGWSVEKMQMTHMEMTYTVVKSDDEGLANPTDCRGDAAAMGRLRYR